MIKAINDDGLITIDNVRLWDSYKVDDDLQYFPVAGLDRDNNVLIGKKRWRR